LTPTSVFSIGSRPSLPLTRTSYTAESAPRPRGRLPRLRMLPGAIRHCAVTYY